MANTTTEFERELQEQTQIKNIPNSEFVNGQFKFADYFDMEGFKESFTGSVEDEDELVDEVFEPYEVYFAGVPEVETLREQDEMYWFHATIDIPEDANRQKLLAALVSDAIAQRNKR